MSKSSEAVKKWRRTTKERIIASLGGSCCVCGYNKCSNALACHHLDPNKKDLAMGAIRANPVNWITIVEELRKCILVCHNCHCEIHAGVISVPENAPRFDEKYNLFKDLLKTSKKEELNPCPMCGAMKHISKINCSRSCASKSAYKINWDNIDLAKETLTKTVTKIAEELGCSDVAVHKRLKKLGLK